MRLFDDFERSNPSPASYGEHTFAFFNRAQGIVWERIREVLDLWFAAYPAEHAADLRGRFRSKQPGAHHGAWWELYLHRLFTRLDYDVVVHPPVPGTSRTPDFLLHREGERTFVEAAVVFSGIVDEETDGVREGWIMDAVDRGSDPNFMLGIEFEQRGMHRPRDRQVYRPLEDWLGQLDPDDVIAQQAQGGELPTRLLEIGDWRVRFRAIPVNPEARGEKPRGRLLGMGPASAGRVDDQTQILDTLKHKRGAYGELGAPLVVAINCASSFPSDEDIAAALYGSIGYRYEVGVTGSGQAVRLRDGTWMDEKGPRGRRMSAVLSGVQIHPSTVVKTQPRLWLNPWAYRPLAADLPFTTWTCSDRGELEERTHFTYLSKLFGVTPDWPGPERPFD